MVPHLTWCHFVKTICEVYKNSLIFYVIDKLNKKRKNLALKH